MATKKRKDEPRPTSLGDAYKYQVWLNRYCEIQQCGAAAVWAKAYDEGFFTMSEFLEHEQERLGIDLSKSPNTWPLLDKK